MKARDVLLHLSCGFYAILLYAYPSEFRARYKKEMALAFKEELRQTLSSTNLWSRLQFPIQMSRDLVASALRERLALLDAVGMSCLVAASAIGLCASYVDHHNATEVYPTLSIALIGSFVLGLIRPTRPWRWAIAIAPWVPFAGSMSNLTDRLSSPGAWAILAVVLVPGFAGAVGGSLVRQAIGLCTNVTKEA
ncbi:MAG: hypothetical protein M3O30_10810 [Planctomycetota bacterium]|nr:hypothetical protein [Planctomycetota bacterium]